MVDVKREISFLPPKADLVVQTAAFEQMKKQLAAIRAAAEEQEEVGRPSLKMPQEQGCRPPKKLEYTPQQPIEDLCSSPPRLRSARQRLAKLMPEKISSRFGETGLAPSASQRME